MIWLSSVALPLFFGLLALIPRHSGFALRWLTAAGALPALALCFLSPPEPSVYSTLLLSTRFGFGSLGKVFLLATSLVWTAAALFSPAYLKSDKHKGRFAFFFLLTMSGNFGLIVARDLASFYAFFALMTYAAYGLIIHNQTDEARRAGRIYMVMSLLGESGIIAAVVLVIHTAPGILAEEAGMAVAASPHRLAILLAALLGFGVKAGAFLLHFWLPLAHPAAPSPASAVLSGCMIKAGLLGWIYFMPLHGRGDPLLGGFIILLGLAALFFGVLAGLTSNRPKTILAYSSISQMGLMTLCLGLGVYAPMLWPALRPVLLLLVLTHALSKGGLFLMTGAAQSAGRNGVWSVLILCAAGLLTLVLSGFPLTGGAVVKTSLKHILHSEASVFSLPLNELLTASAAGTMLVLGHFLVRLWTVMPQGTRRPSAGLWLPCCALLIAAGLSPPLLDHVFDPVRSIPPVDTGPFWKTAWPVMLGLALVVGLELLRRRTPLARHWPRRVLHFHVSEGLEYAALWLGRSMDRALAPLRMDLAQLASKIAEQDVASTLTGRIERRFLHWHTAGLVFVLLLVCFLLLTYWTAGP